jgi:MFS transporter, YNFM family, putative membrane transport protein
VNQTIFLLAVAAANSGLAMRLVEPMLPRLADDFRTTVPATAAVISAFALAHAGAQYFHGPLGDRFGKLRVMTVLLALSAVAAFGCAAATDLDSLIAWRFATGLFSSASMTLGMAYLADVVPAATRQPVLARFISGTIIGQSLGPFVGGALTDLFGWRAAFIALGAVFAVVAAVLGVGTRAEWRSEPRSSGPLFSPVRHLSILRLPRARAVLVSVFVEMVLFYGAFSLLGAMLKARFDLPYTIIGALLAGFGIGGLIYTSAVRWMLARLGQRGCVVAGGLIGATCYFVILATPVWPVVGLCTVGLGFAFYSMHNTLQTKATEMAPQSRATGMSLFSMAWAGGQAVGAGLMGAGAAAVGYAPMIAAFAIGYAALGVGLRARLGRL